MDNYFDIENHFKELIVFQHQFGLSAKDIAKEIVQKIKAVEKHSFEKGYATSKKDYDSWSTGATELAKILYKEQIISEVENG